MKIASSKADIVAATRLVENAVQGGDDATISSHFLFRVTDRGLQVLASNGKRLLASAFVPNAVVEGDPKSFTVSAWRFGQLLKLSPDGPCTIDFDGSTAKVNIDGRTIRFASLDPSTFPYWDSTFDVSVETGRVSAGRLFAALSYIRPFVSTLDTRTPALAATECREGSFLASDSQSLSKVTVAGLEKSAIRIHFGDITGVNAFLGLGRDLDIVVREHDTTLFLVRPDGAVYGVSRWTHQFPNLKIDSDTTRATFDIDVESFRYGIRFLSVAAAKGDDSLRFEFRDGGLVLSVSAVAGGREEFKVVTKGLTGIAALSDIGRSDFDINTNHITGILDTVSEDTVSFGVNWTPKNGYILHRHTVDGDDHIAIVVWKKK